MTWDLLEKFILIIIKINNLELYLYKLYIRFHKIKYLDYLFIKIDIKKC